MTSGFRVHNECIEYEGEVVARLKPGMLPGVRQDLETALDQYEATLEENNNMPNKEYILEEAKKKSKAGLISLVELEEILE